METQVHRGGARPGEPSSPLLRLYLLGRFEAVREDAPIPAHAWRRRRPADLLQLVALTPGRALGRDQAIDALWPDKDPASGANNLHRALYDLRQILGGRWVDIERGQVRMRPDVWVDVDAFEQAIADGGRERLAEAVSLYRGDLCPGEREVPWLSARRAVLRARFVEAAYPLARAHAEAGAAAQAIPLLRRLLEVDPAAEDAHRQLMRLLAESGRRAEALRQYDACEGALRTAGVAVSDDTRLLRQAIQRGEVGHPQARPALDGVRRAARRLLGTVDPPPVRGRGAILLLFESLVERGSGTLVLLGERGVGKTRLAVEGARIAQSRGAVVLSCVAGAQGAGVPYGLFADLFREECRLAQGVADPFADANFDGRASAEAVRLRVFDAVTRGLATLGEGRPVYLLLDELHDADESSLNLLHHLALHAGAQRLMIVGTCREDRIHAGTPIQMALSHLDGGRLARGIRVPRLGLVATREQVADLVGGVPPDALVEQVYRVTDGCPFLVEEAVRAQRETGHQVPAEPRAGLRARVARLGPRVEGLLAAAAVAGQRFDFELVRPVTGLTAHEAVGALEACLEHGLLDEDGSGYHFHHGMVRDAILAGLEPTRRAALHGALADALEASAGHEPPSEALARHRREAGQPERALRHLVAAGHRAAARAGLREAVAFYAEALELLAGQASPDPALRLELLEAMGRVQLELGEVSGAARSFGDAALLAGTGGAGRPDVRARSHRLAAIAHAAAGRIDSALAEVAAGLEPAGDEPAPLLHLRAQLDWHRGQYAEARESARACAEAAGRAGDADLLARSHDLSALARGMLGEASTPEDESDAVGLADRRAQDAAPEHPLDLHLVLWDRDLLGDLACAELARGAGLLVDRARLREAPEAQAAGRLGEGTFALAAGQLEAAELAIRAALDGFRSVGSALGEALALERLGLLLTVLGHLEEARSVLGEAVVVAERSSLRRHALTRIHAAEVRHRLASGLTAAAEDALHEASETAARHGDCLACDAAFRPEAVRVALARGRIPDADLEVLSLEEIARQRGGRGLAAVARLARARVLAGQGRTDDARAALAQARFAFLAGGQRYDAARCVRLEARLGGALPDDLKALDALVRVDADA
ncbi:transcriptional activator domain [Anaeromyxobacter sp. K]|uniref:ATP-binding protein n=1 Tax=Anaeromyxobacter sp. (strain K) TaxID=447217 RepID=UPI00015F8655|nr:BTAD domain-containing putative transcriptional regulator [Anaeromyxobacter sp. K]ACG74579.1 transcriptional activator domain [Anaeromyxobacter sp. K]